MTGFVALLVSWCFIGLAGSLFLVAGCAVVIARGLLQRDR